MVIAIRIFSPEVNDFRFVGPGWVLRTHERNEDCEQNGCALHNPSDTVQNRERWPYNWRTDRGILERICEHGVGHPDIDSANFLRRIGKAEENVHGCDFCCSRQI